MTDRGRPQQLALGVALRDSAEFANFWDDGVNRTAVAALHDLARARNAAVSYIWGAGASGKTHLLQAACHEARRAGLQAAYLSLRESASLQPAVLEGWEGLDLVCLDDIEGIAGKAEWERALFMLFNELRGVGGNLVLGACAPPRELALSLPDLVSRLAWGGVFRLEPVPEADRLTVLQLRATARGLDLPPDTGRYLLRQSRRDMASLCRLLDTLDTASLEAQRRLTVPFVREILDADRD